MRVTQGSLQEVLMTSHYAQTIMGVPCVRDSGEGDKIG